MTGSEKPEPRRRLSQLGGTTDLGDCAIAVEALLRGRGRVDGTDIARFEQSFAHRVRSAHGIALATGRLGLTAVLTALGIGRGDEVLVPVPTHVVVPNAVRYAGCEPVFVDCRPTTANIDLEAATRLVGERTRALILQHTFGVPADIDRALELARRHDLSVIEDCVHALGATWRGHPVGSLGIAGFFSTEETKMISTTLGGVVVTDDEELADHVRHFVASCPLPTDADVRRRMAKLLAYHALTWPPVHRSARALYESVGKRHPFPKPVSAAESAGGFPPDYRERFSNAQARVGVRQLHRLDANLEHRRRIAAVYASGLPDGHRVEVPTVADPSWVRYPLVVSDRDAAEEACRASTVLGNWFTSVLEESHSPEVAGYEQGSCPVAERLCSHLVNLPTHQRVSESDARAIMAAVRPWTMDWREVACQIS